MKWTAMRRDSRTESLWVRPRWRRITASLQKNNILTLVREGKIMRQRAQTLALFLVVSIGAASQHAQALNLGVNCDKHESIRKALRLLATGNPQWLNKITVSGSCKGNFVIQGMD